jgi:flagellar hook-associated protein FlgK
VSTGSANEFFEVTDARGQRLYTRNLSIGLNPLDFTADMQNEIVINGRVSDLASDRVALVSPEGYTVSGADSTGDRVTATARFDTLGISIDSVETTDSGGTTFFPGTVRTKTPAISPESQNTPTHGMPIETIQPYQLYVVRFNNPRGLTDLGNGYFGETANAGKDYEQSPVVIPFTVVQSGAREAAFQTSSTWARLRGVYEGFKSDVFRAFGATVDNLTTKDVSDLELPGIGGVIDFQLVARAANNLLAGRARTEADMTRMTGEVGQRKVSNDAVTTTLTSMSTQIESERAQVSGVSMDEEALDLVRLQQAYAGAAKVVEVANKMFDDLMASI